jgi:hypothetical protein
MSSEPSFFSYFLVTVYFLTSVIVYYYYVFLCCFGCFYEEKRSSSRAVFATSSAISFPGISIWPGPQRMVLSLFLSDSYWFFFELMTPSTPMCVLKESVMINRRLSVRWVTYITLMIISCSAL